MCATPHVVIESQLRASLRSRGSALDTRHTGRANTRHTTVNPRVRGYTPLRAARARRPLGLIATSPFRSTLAQRGSDASRLAQLPRSPSTRMDGHLVSTREWPRPRLPGGGLLDDPDSPHQARTHASAGAPRTAHSPPHRKKSWSHGSQTDRHRAASAARATAPRPRLLLASRHTRRREPSYHSVLWPEPATHWRRAECATRNTRHPSRSPSCGLRARRWPSQAAAARHALADPTSHRRGSTASASARRRRALLLGSPRTVTLPPSPSQLVARSEPRRRSPRVLLRSSRAPTRARRALSLRALSLWALSPCARCPVRFRRGSAAQTWWC